MWDMLSYFIIEKVLIDYIQDAKHAQSLIVGKIHFFLNLTSFKFDRLWTKLGGQNDNIMHVHQEA
jgi:hypothetical protein